MHGVAIVLLLAILCPDCLTAHFEHVHAGEHIDREHVQDVCSAVNVACCDHTKGFQKKKLDPLDVCFWKGHKLKIRWGFCRAQSLKEVALCCVHLVNLHRFKDG